MIFQNQSERIVQTEFTSVTRETVDYSRLFKNALKELNASIKQIHFAPSENPLPVTALDKIQEAVKSLQSFIFESNDETTRQNITQNVTAYLNESVDTGQLQDFVVICDDSNNPLNVINDNKLYVDICIKPTKSVEFLFLPIRIVLE
jgi:phage tail sheath protein FI